MDTKAAIAHLEALGYSVFPAGKDQPVVYVCNSGHAHKTAAARDKCDKPKSGATKAREAASYVAAYDMRSDGKTFREIGDVLGVGPQRAIQIFKKAERVRRTIGADMGYPQSEAGLSHEIRQLFLERDGRPNGE